MNCCFILFSIKTWQEVEDQQIKIEEIFGEGVNKEAM